MSIDEGGEDDWSLGRQDLIATKEFKGRSNGEPICQKGWPTLAVVVPLKPYFGTFADT